MNPRIDHAASFHAQNKDLAVRADESLRKREYILDVFFGQNRDAGSHNADEGNGNIPLPGLILKNVDGSGFCRIALDQPRFFHFCKIAMNRRAGFQSHGIADFANRRRIAFPR